MKYGERLKIAIDRRGDQLHRAISRKELGIAIGCSPQNIGMILTGAKGEDQKLSTEKHALAAAFLNVNPSWLLNESGDIAVVKLDHPSSLSSSARELGALFDLIPESEIIQRVKAFNAASAAIMTVLQDAEAKAVLTRDLKKSKL